MPGVALRGIEKRFGGHVAVEGVDLDFETGRLTALLGPSGCGKTTLLRMIAGLEAPTRGRILLDGRDITGQPAHERRFGMVFQSFALFPHLSVADNVAYALAIDGVGRAERRRRADELLDLVRLGGLGDRRIGALSGGQRQRVAVARALAQRPAVFLLDEPMSALDAKLREDMQVELRLLQTRLAVTTVVVTHDQREAMTMADRIVVMSDGRIEQVGTPSEIYHRPASAFVAGFIGQASFLDGVVRERRVHVDGGVLDVEPPARFVPGSPVRLCIRPEAMRLHPPDAEGPNRLAGVVRFVRDVGPRREVHVEAAGRVLVAELPADGDADGGWRLGEAVAVELPPERLRVFPGAEPATPLAEAAE
ncbi:MAG: ABC transporter ATP-binding protein [Paracoccaceae bacterium]